ncbi:hypothetical protein D3C77_288130 [compost metagenome]
MNKHVGILLLTIFALLLSAVFLYAGLSVPSHPARSNWLLFGVINMAIFALLAWRMYCFKRSSRGT